MVFIYLNPVKTNPIDCQQLCETVPKKLAHVKKQKESLFKETIEYETAPKKQKLNSLKERNDKNEKNEHKTEMQNEKNHVVEEKEKTQTNNMTNQKDKPKKRTAHSENDRVNTKKEPHKVKKQGLKNDIQKGDQCDAHIMKKEKRENDIQPKKKSVQKQLMKPQSSENDKQINNGKKSKVQENQMDSNKHGSKNKANSTCQQMDGDKHSRKNMEDANNTCQKMDGDKHRRKNMEDANNTCQKMDGNKHSRKNMEDANNTCQKMDGDKHSRKNMEDAHSRKQKENAILTSAKINEDVKEVNDGIKNNQMDTVYIGYTQRDVTEAHLQNKFVTIKACDETKTANETAINESSNEILNRGNNDFTEENKKTKNGDKDQNKVDTDNHNNQNETQCDKSTKENKKILLENGQAKLENDTKNDPVAPQDKSDKANYSTNNEDKKQQKDNTQNSEAVSDKNEPQDKNVPSLPEKKNNINQNSVFQKGQKRIPKKGECNKMSQYDNKMSLSSWLEYKQRCKQNNLVASEMNVSETNRLASAGQDVHQELINTNKKTHEYKSFQEKDQRERISSEISSKIVSKKSQDIRERNSEKQNKSIETQERQRNKSRERHEGQRDKFRERHERQQDKFRERQRDHSRERYEGQRDQSRKRYEVQRDKSRERYHRQKDKSSERHKSRERDKSREIYERGSEKYPGMTDRQQKGRDRGQHDNSTERNGDQKPIYPQYPKYSQLQQHQPYPQCKSDSIVTQPKKFIYRNDFETRKQIWQNRYKRSTSIQSPMYEQHDSSSLSSLSQNDQVIIQSPIYEPRGSFSLSSLSQNDQVTIQSPIYEPRGCSSLSSLSQNDQVTIQSPIYEPRGSSELEFDTNATRSVDTNSANSTVVSTLSINASVNCLTNTRNSRPYLLPTPVQKKEYVKDNLCVKDNAKTCANDTALLDKYYSIHSNNISIGIKGDHEKWNAYQLNQYMQCYKFDNHTGYITCDSCHVTLFWMDAVLHRNLLSHETYSVVNGTESIKCNSPVCPWLGNWNEFEMHEKHWSFTWSTCNTTRCSSCGIYLFTENLASHYDMEFQKNNGNLFPWTFLVQEWSENLNPNSDQKLPSEKTLSENLNPNSDQKLPSDKALFQHINEDSSQSLNQNLGDKLIWISNGMKRQQRMLRTLYSADGCLWNQVKLSLYFFRDGFFIDGPQPVFYKPHGNSISHEDQDREFIPKPNLFLDHFFTTSVDLPQSFHYGPFFFQLLPDDTLQCLFGHKSWKSQSCKNQSLDDQSLEDQLQKKNKIEEPRCIICGELLTNWSTCDNGDFIYSDVTYDTKGFCHKNCTLQTNAIECG